MEQVVIQPQKVHWVRYSGMPQPHVMSFTARSDQPIDTFIVDENGFNAFFGGKNFHSYSGRGSSREHVGSVYLPLLPVWYLIIGNPSSVQATVQFDVQVRDFPLIGQIDLKPVIQAALAIKPDIQPFLRQIIEAWVQTPEAKAQGVIGVSVIENPAERASLKVEMKNVGPNGEFQCDLTKFIEFACFVWKSPA